ncbi:unnamed protein product [Prorocentrum cordatum]|uniref:Methyltransferase domain-containing protein n=1 Tax=Prorocentrum cordatum TaxID=2364126 RepID=A0ABN9T7A7_9DINO|nr:unnamed protein product [Polarella glacialis]
MRVFPVFGGGVGDIMASSSCSRFRGDPAIGADMAAMRAFLANPSAPPRLYGFSWEDGFVAPWVACSDAPLDEALAELRPTELDLVADLGCGDGRVLARAVERSGCRALGVELDPALLEKAEALLSERLPPALRGLVELRQGDLFEEADAWSAVACAGDGVGEGQGGPLPTIVPPPSVLYLLGDALRRLRGPLEPLLATGAAVCTLGWELPGWPHYESARGQGWYVYRAPSAAGGAPAHDNNEACAVGSTKRARRQRGLQLYSMQSVDTVFTLARAHIEDRWTRTWDKGLLLFSQLRKEDPNFRHGCSPEGGADPSGRFAEGHRRLARIAYTASLTLESPWGEARGGPARAAGRRAAAAAGRGCFAIFRLSGVASGGRPF